MVKLFLKIIDLSILASYLILAVMVARFLLRKAPKNISCFLWLLVGIRLVCPFAVESVFSLIPDSEVVSEEKLYQLQPAMEVEVATDDEEISEYPADLSASPARSSVNQRQILIYLLSCVWLIGMFAMVLYLVISWLRLKRCVKMAVPRDVAYGVDQTRIYQSSNISSPFLFGLLRPRIYVPYTVKECDLPYIIFHEKAHMKRKDYLIKPIGFLILTVYWFNPFVWCAYILLCRDIELACDERVLRTVGTDCKKAYSQALLGCAVNRRMIVACPVAFGEVGVKERIKNVLNYKKPAFWMIVIALLVCIIIPVCFMTQKKKDTQPDIMDQVVEETNLKNGINSAGISVHDEVSAMPAKWSLNTLIDTEFPEIVYADEHKVIFYAYFGMFVYDLDDEKILYSLDLKAIQCQKVQRGGNCEIQVSQDGREIWITPYGSEEMYRFIPEDDTLSKTQNCKMEDGFSNIVSNRVLADTLGAKIRLCSDHVVDFDDGTYGFIYTESAQITTITYRRGERLWYLFTERDKPEPEVLKQDDSFYASYRAYANESLTQFVYAYTIFYEQGDYAGICALSRNLQYSDEEQRQWKDRGFCRVQSSMTEIPDATEQDVMMTGETGDRKVLKLIQVDNLWYADGLPADYQGK